MPSKLNSTSCWSRPTNRCVTALWRCKRSPSVCVVVLRSNKHSLLSLRVKNIWPCLPALRVAKPKENGMRLKRNICRPRKPLIFLTTKTQRSLTKLSNCCSALLLTKLSAQSLRKTSGHWVSVRLPALHVRLRSSKVIWTKCLTNCWFRLCQSVWKCPRSTVPITCSKTSAKSKPALTLSRASKVPVKNVMH